MRSNVKRNKKTVKKYGNPQRSGGAGPDLASWEISDMCPAMLGLASLFDVEMESKHRPHMVLKPWNGLRAWMMIDAASGRGVEETYDRFYQQYLANIKQLLKEGVPDDVAELMNVEFVGEENEEACVMMLFALSVMGKRADVPTVTHYLPFVHSLMDGSRLMGCSAQDCFVVFVHGDEENGVRIKLGAAVPNVMMSVPA